MNRLLSVSILTLLVHFGASAGAEQLDWEELIDKSALDYQDPYVGLVYEQLEDLRTIVQQTKRLEEASLSETDRSAGTEKLAAARSRLAEGGLDADWLISQRWVVAERRKKAAMAANPALDGETVTLGGFAVPAPPRDDGTRIVYLVPERGMCSHTPPPSPNQMIRARLTSEWSPTMMHEPVRLTGTLTVEETQHSFNIVDGFVEMRSSFVMDVHEVETMPRFGRRSPEIYDRAARIADRLRTAKDGGTNGN